MHTLPKQQQQQAQQDVLCCSYADNSGASLMQQHVFQVGNSTPYRHVAALQETSCSAVAHTTLISAFLQAI
jgi:hypothetical protein